MLAGEETWLLNDCQPSELGASVSASEKELHDPLLLVPASEMELLDPLLISL
jgi:hypothetical protein